MYVLITDAKFNSVMLVLIATVGIVPATLTVWFSRRAAKNSQEAADQVKTNGGMSDPNPNVNDHIKYQTEMLETVLQRQNNHENLLADHISHSRLMDTALAEVYLFVKPHMVAQTSKDENHD